MSALEIPRPLPHAELPSGDLPSAVRGLLQAIEDGRVRVNTPAQRRLAHRLVVAMAAFDSGRRVLGGIDEDAPPLLG